MLTTAWTSRGNLSSRFVSSESPTVLTTVSSLAKSLCWSPPQTNGSSRLTTSMSPSLSKPDSPPHLPGSLRQQVPTSLPRSRTLALFRLHHLRSHQCIHHRTSLPSASTLHPQMAMTFFTGHLCRHLPACLSQTLLPTHTTRCGLQDMSMSQKIMGRGLLGCMHEIWHGHLHVCRRLGEMLRHAFARSSLVLHGSRQHTIGIKTPSSDRHPPKLRNVGHCPDPQAVCGPTGSQLQRVGRSLLPRARRALKSELWKTFIATDVIAL